MPAGERRPTPRIDADDRIARAEGRMADVARGRVPPVRPAKRNCLSAISESAATAGVPA